MQFHRWMACTPTLRFLQHARNYDKKAIFPAVNYIVNDTNDISTLPRSVLRLLKSGIVAVTGEDAANDWRLPIFSVALFQSSPNYRLVLCSLPSSAACA